MLITQWFRVLSSHVTFFSLFPQGKKKWGRGEGNKEGRKEGKGKKRLFECRIQFRDVSFVNIISIPKF